MNGATVSVVCECVGRRRACGIIDNTRYRSLMAGRVEQVGASIWRANDCISLRSVDEFIYLIKN
jgi:hypothetical protein